MTSPTLSLNLLNLGALLFFRRESRLVDLVRYVCVSVSVFVSVSATVAVAVAVCVYLHACMCVCVCARVCVCVCVFKSEHSVRKCVNLSI